ncbi:MAG: slipin family protein [Caulobacterales bacterium]|nr:slipin family protein [Caulobacterales bacterium]
MWKTYEIKEHERGLLIRDGRLRRVLEPGRHRFYGLGRRTHVEMFDVRLPAFTSEWARVMEKNHPRLAARYLEIVRTEPHETALVAFEGQPAFVVTPGRTAVFWKVLRDVTVERIDLSAAHRVDRALFEAWGEALGRAVTLAEVGEAETGLVFVDGALVERVGAGRHVFWSQGREVKVVRLDLRPQAVEVAAQEILTKDRVSLRLTLTAFVTITDAERLVRATPDHEAAVYRLVQFAAREAVGGRTLDEVLNERTAVDAEIAESVRARLGDVGLAVGELRVKDVILPGDMRMLLNRVVEAEKAAQANLIRRREETAATRSLLNTARLMDDNPTLMRLKELETLEKLTERIGRIDLHAGQGAALDTLLTGLVRIGPANDTAEA